jgi:dolichyl-diphosphooligosaccharide---protein glycosyltransferase
MAEEMDVQGILDRLRPNRLQAIEISVLATIAIVAAILRTLPLQYGAYFTAFDPFFQYRVTEYIVENGFSSWWTWHDTLSWYPMGRNISMSSYPGVPFLAAFFYLIQNSLGLGISVYNVCLYFPIIMAVLTIITIYYLGKEIYNRFTGIFAALFMAIIPAFIHRTSIGFFDTENIGIFAITATSLFFLKSSDKKKSIEKRTIYGLLSGASLGLIFASWGAAKYMVGMLALYMIFLVISERYETRHLISYTITLGIGYLIALITPKIGTNNLLGIDNLAVFSLVFILIIYEYIKDKIDIGVVSVASLGVFLLVVLSIFILPALGINIPIGYKFLKVLNPFTSVDSYIYQSIAENRVIPWSSLFNDFSIILTLSVFGSYLSIKKLDEKNLYSVLFFLSALYFAGVMSRLSQILTAPACLIGGYGIVAAIAPFLKKQAPPTSRAARRRRRVYGVSRPLVFIFTGFLLLSMVPNVYRSLSVADQPTSLASSSISVPIEGEYAKDWPEALEWMKVNITDDAVVCSWWDYGYWIEAMSNKTTMADGSTRITRQIANIGKIMMLQPNESIKLLEKYDVDYIVVFVTYDPNNIQNQWPFGDNVKWQWMVQIAGLDLDDYLNQTSRSYGDAYMASTLVKLMYQQLSPFDVFEPVYVSEHGYVKIYKINYPE